LNWDGTALTIAGAVISGVVLTGTSADAFTLNSDLQDVNADLALGRTTGGSATLRWNGTIAAIDKNFQCPTLNLTGGQISFPAAQSASADGNTLDDYEENTWASDVGATSNFTGTPTLSDGRYTKIGNVVTLQGVVTANATTGGLQSYMAFTIPFTAAHVTCGAAFQNSGTMGFCYVTGSTLYIFWPAASGIKVNSDSYYFEVTYRV